jgi:hypothetical protein
VWRATRREITTAYLELRLPTDPAMSSAAADRLAAIELASFQSPLVLSAALRTPGIGQLPSVTRQRDPAAWLAERLHVKYAADSPVLELQLEGRPGDGADDQQILTALIAAQRLALAGDPEGAGRATIRVIQPPLVHGP